MEVHLVFQLGYRYSTEIIFTNDNPKKHNWQEAISWQFKSVAKDLNYFGMNRKQIQILVRAALEPRNARLLNWSSDHSAMKISIMPALHFMLQLKHYVQNYASILYLTVVISESCQSQ